MKPPSAKSCPVCGERYEGDVLFCPKDGTPLTSPRTASLSGTEDPYVGLELAGQIRIRHLIGIGSMGRVYRAFQAGIERDVAVKILHRELSGNAELVARFHREAKVASRLVHPNVVQVLMTGTVPLRSDPRVGGEMYLVMEYLDGISLLSALAAAGNTGDTAALPLPRALHAILQLCDAVGEAHAQGIVHRDLKPENVMLIRRGEDPDFVKVLDFGIARIDWANQSMATQAGLIFGTAKYISPEGAAGEGVGPPADVYSIATILYQCLAGRAPFEDESPVALLVQHTHSAPPELRSIPRAAYVPAPIAEVIMQNLAKKPGARAQDARAFGRDLVAAMRAGGLDPEEIIAHSTLLVRGAVRLASHARTKNMDMTPELASVIAQASKAPPLATPPPPVTTPPLPAPAATAAAEATAAPAAPAGPPPLPAPRPPEAILVGVRPTDTMVVDASELIDVMPPPLPAPPPVEGQAAPGSEEVEDSEGAANATGDAAADATSEAAASATGNAAAVAEGVTEPDGGAASAGGGAVAASPAAASDGPAAASDGPAAASDGPAAASGSWGAASGGPGAVSGSWGAVSGSWGAVSDSPAAASGSWGAVSDSQARVSDSQARVSDSQARVSDSQARVSDSLAEAGAARASAPALDPATDAPGRAGAPPAGDDAPERGSVPSLADVPPALRTLFDAPAPEAVSVVPPLAAEAGLAPVAPSRPGGTVVGPSPFEEDGIEAGSAAPAPVVTADPARDGRQSLPGAAPVTGAAHDGRPSLPRAGLEWSDDGTIQGATTEPAPERRRRSRWSRAVAILALGAVAALSAVGFAQYLSQASSSSAEETSTVDELVEQARECARMRAWDSPPGANVKEITGRALELSPNEPRVLDIRRDSAEKIVTEALGKKYAGHTDDALHLAKLALEMSPELTTAQHLVAELEQAAAAASASADASASPDASASATADASASTAPEAPTAQPTVAIAPTAGPKPTGKPSLPTAGAPTAKSTGSSVAPAKTGKPHQPPPGTTGPAVLPQPTSTGPWL